jgi:hypothetical protein
VGLKSELEQTRRLRDVATVFFLAGESASFYLFKRLSHDDEWLHLIVITRFHSTKPTTNGDN